MGRPNKFQIMKLFKADITQVLHQNQKDLLTETDLSNVLEENRSAWKLPLSASLDDFIDFLVSKEQILEHIELDFPNKEIRRYFLKDKEQPSVYQIACSFHEKAYLSHYTAAFHHGITDNIVKTVYINQEQSPKKNNVWIPTQLDINNAFSKPMRTTNQVTTYKGHKIHWLTGKNTGQLGVVEESGLRLTNIERTLIDVVVRPKYGGGVHEILTMYENSKDQISVNKIYSYLKKLDHGYPYHQSIGFYLEKAGYKENSLRLLERFPIINNFYLDYELKDVNYSERWKLFYPAYMD